MASSSGRASRPTRLSTATGEPMAREAATRPGRCDDVGLLLVIGLFGLVLRLAYVSELACRPLGRCHG